jgi:GLPGLI family protein
MENGEMKTTEVMDTVNVVAWFTTDIPVAVGPDFQGQLPGAILELEVNNGRMVYKAVEVSPKVNVAKIKAPTKGKAVTQKEFRDESEKLLKEMQGNMGGNNRIMIRQ